MELKKYSGIMLRTAIAIVLLWFGFTQIKNPTPWVRLLPEILTSSGIISATTFIYINGTFEIIFGTLLLLGLFTRTVSLILTLHLLNIVYTVGYGPIGARDFAIALSCLAIFLNGSDEFCLDKLILNKKEENKNKEELVKKL